MITLHTTDGPARSSWWGRPIEDCFRDQVRLRPGATAVVDGEEHFSYQELFARSVAVARGLVAVGVQRETLVGMAFERSAQAIVAMLGIVLAGGAYLPINPSYPARRIAQILRASGGHLVLCPSGGAAAIKSVAPAEVDVREIDEVMAHGGDPHEFASPAVPAGRSPLAYVMYTSGSTGEPKGVMVEHAGILRLVKDTDYIDFSPANRVLHAAALEFDASTLEVWGALLNGARLCVVDQETTVVPARFAAALRENGITNLLAHRAAVPPDRGRGPGHPRAAAHAGDRRRRGVARPCMPGAGAQSSAADLQRLRPDREHDVYHGLPHRARP